MSLKFFSGWVDFHFGKLLTQYVELNLIPNEAPEYVITTNV